MVQGQSIQIGFSFISGAKGFIDRFFPNLFTGRVSLFLMGAQGTGKTSFLKTLQYLSIEDIRNTGRSTLLEKTETNYVLEGRRSLTLTCYDFGGDNAFDDARRQAVIDIIPLAILFFWIQEILEKKCPNT